MPDYSRLFQPFIEARTNTNNARYQLLLAKANQKLRRKEKLEERDYQNTLLERRYQQEQEQQAKHNKTALESNEYTNALNLLDQVENDPAIADSTRGDLETLRNQITTAQDNDQDGIPDIDKLTPFLNRIRSRSNMANAKRTKAQNQLEGLDTVAGYIKSEEGVKKLIEEVNKIRSTIGYDPIPDDFDFSDPSQLNKIKLQNIKDAEKEEKAEATKKKDLYRRTEKRLETVIKQIENRRKSLLKDSYEGDSSSELNYLNQQIGKYRNLLDDLRSVGTEGISDKHTTFNYSGYRPPRGNPPANPPKPILGIERSSPEQVAEYIVKLKQHDPNKPDAEIDAIIREYGFDPDDIFNLVR